MSKPEPERANDSIEAEDETAFSSHGVLNLSELHPLIFDAAEPHWAVGAYGEAVEAAWYAIRDELRELLDSTLDGARLVNLIGENEPNLLLTDFVSETEQSMHRGVVRLLGGVALYVRNPMSHEPSAPNADDPIRCFEYLAVMSLCARHLSVAVHPTSVEQIVAEASQLRFSATKEAVADLIGALPAAHRPALVAALAGAFQDAFVGEDLTRAINLRDVYLGAIDEGVSDAATLRRAGRICARLLTDDSTFDIGIGLLDKQVFGALSVRHRAKVVHALVEDIRAGRRRDDRNTRGGRYSRVLLSLFAGFVSNERERVIKALIGSLNSSDVEAQLFAIAVVASLSLSMASDESASVAAALVVALSASRWEGEMLRAARLASYVMSAEFGQEWIRQIAVAMAAQHNNVRLRWSEEQVVTARSLANTIRWNIGRRQNAR